jgi:hypothetical protein
VQVEAADVGRAVAVASSGAVAEGCGTEEAVLNALWAAPEVVGRKGRVGRALPHDDVLGLLDAHGHLHR